jgi:hypothetical protein
MILAKLNKIQEKLVENCINLFPDDPNRSDSMPSSPVSRLTNDLPQYERQFVICVTAGSAYQVGEQVEIVVVILNR